MNFGPFSVKFTPVSMKSGVFSMNFTGRAERRNAAALWDTGDLMNQPDPHAPLPITPESILASVTGGTPRRREWMRTWRPSDFRSFSPPKDFVLMGDHHLTRGGLSVLGGAPGVGKSRAALGLAISGATGRPWMGLPVHCRYRTLIVQIENGEFRLKKELDEAFSGMPEVDMDEWLLITPPPAHGLAFGEPGFREEFTRVLATFRPGLVIIDPWNRVAEGDKQGDYRAALDDIFSCLPAAAEEKPAVLILHHMRKKGSEPGSRKLGRDLLHELAGSYQIGSAARCVFILEAASNQTADRTVVLTCCKNNDGMEGHPSAWLRGNGLFLPATGFDMEAYLEGDKPQGNGNAILIAETVKVLCGMRGETKGQAAKRLVDAGVCQRSKAYMLLENHPNIETDAAGKLWWREDEIQP